MPDNLRLVDTVYMDELRIIASSIRLVPQREENLHTSVEGGAEELKILHNHLLIEENGRVAAELWSDINDRVSSSMKLTLLTTEGHEEPWQTLDVAEKPLAMMQIEQSPSHHLKRE